MWLVGLIAALQPLGLSGVLTPVTAMTNEVFAFLPRAARRGLFFFAGLILAASSATSSKRRSAALNLERLLPAAPESRSANSVAVDETRVAQPKASPRRAARSPRRSE